MEKRVCVTNWAKMYQKQEMLKIIYDNEEFSRLRVFDWFALYREGLIDINDLKSGHSNISKNLIKK